MKNDLLILLLFTSIFISCSEEEPSLPTSISSFTVSSQRVTYGQEVDVRVILDNESSDQSILWYVNKVGESRQKVGSGKSVSFVAAEEVGDYVISVEITDGIHNSYESIDTIEVYGLAEEWFRKPSSSWALINGPKIETHENGVSIDIAEGEIFGGIGASISSFVEGVSVVPPFQVRAEIVIDSKFDVDEYFILRLDFKNPETYRYLRYTGIRIFPQLNVYDNSWYPSVRVYNTKTSEYEDGQSKYSFLSDLNDVIANNQLGEKNELYLEVLGDYTIAGGINNQQTFLVSPEDLILDEGQVNWELDRIIITTNSGIILNRVVIQ